MSFSNTLGCLVDAGARGRNLVFPIAGYHRRVLEELVNQAIVNLDEIGLL